MSGQNNRVQTNRVDFFGDDGEIAKSLYLSAGVLSIDGSIIETGSNAPLTNAHVLVGNASNIATDVALSGDATMANTGALTVLNSAVIGKVLTGYVSGAGTVAATDTILQAINKLNGNTAVKMTNPMTLGGDLVYGGALGVPTALANGSAGQVLTSAGTTLAPAWTGPTTITTWTSPVTTWVSNVTWTGTITEFGNVGLPGFKYFELQGACTGAPTSATLRITLPNSWTLNSAFNTAAPFASATLVNDAGVENYANITILKSSSTQIGLSYSGVSVAKVILVGDVTQAAPITFGNGDFVFIKFFANVS